MYDGPKWAYNTTQFPSCNTNALQPHAVRLALGSMSSFCELKVRIGWFLWMSSGMYGDAYLCLINEEYEYPLFDLEPVKVS